MKQKVSQLIKLTRSSSTLTKESTKASSILEKSKIKLFQVMSIYEEAIGLKEIKEAQEQVLQSERKFVDAQQERRVLNTRLTDVQQRLRQLREEMERLHRHDSRYLQLFTDEHNTLKHELTLANEYKVKENEERELFFFLSTSLRNAQEKERARVERIKYLQLGLSVLCTSLGIISAYVYNYFRNNSILEILNYDREQFERVHATMDEIMRRQEGLVVGLTHNFERLSTNTKVVQQTREIQPIAPTPIPSVIEPNQIIELSEQNEFIYLHPYVLSALFLFGFILFSTNK